MGYYGCNHCAASLLELGCRYETAKKKGDYDEETQKRENAKQALERYMHYYQRWAENDKARLQVLPNSTSQTTILLSLTSKGSNVMPCSDNLTLC